MTAAMQVEMRDWRELAACGGVDPEVFFPAAASGRAYAEQVAKAKAICGRCPVREQCLAFALGALAHGVAGGLTAEERHALRAAGGPASRRAGPAEWQTARERADVGRAALRSGRRPADVVAEFGVTDRTVARWAAEVRAEQMSTDVGEESRGGSRALLRVSRNTNALAGTAVTPEGHRG